MAESQLAEPDATLSSASAPPGDCLVDTNVLILGSAALEPRYQDISVSDEAVERVFAWLAAFRTDAERRLVLDDAWKIYEEYHHKLSGQHYGLQVIHHKLQRCLRTLPVSYDDDGWAVVPDGLKAVDNSDKKFVAAALNDPTGVHIVNATDSDSAEHQAVLQAHQITVVELLP